MRCIQYAMSVWLAMFLGLVQGLTEFLPVSSSGHLILFQHLFGIDADMMLFNIVLHVATLCAVLFVFRRRIWGLVKNPFQKTNFVLVLSTVLTVAFVLAFRDFIENTFTASILPVTFMVTAIILFSTSFVCDKPLLQQGGVSYFSGAMAGLAQGLAVIPGLSRSGTTIAVLLSTGTRKTDAAEFSFLMSIPIIVAALVYELAGSVTTSYVDGFAVGMAFVVALVSGIFAIRLMLHIVKRIKLYWFSVYLVVLAILTMFVIQ